MAFTIDHSVWQGGAAAFLGNESWMELLEQHGVLLLRPGDQEIAREMCPEMALHVLEGSTVHIEDPAAKVRLQQPLLPEMKVNPEGEPVLWFVQGARESDESDPAPDLLASARGSRSFLTP
jgi:hypothetical protein